MNDLITIIIPTYNTENFISRAIKSLQNQTYSEIEMLIVDDYSNDNTLPICYKLQKTDKRIKIISKNKNTGVANSRNIGIRNAKGKYIMFLDSDDYVEKDFCLCMINTLKKYNAEIVYCDYTVIKDEDKIHKKLGKGEGIVSHQEMMKTVIASSYLWNKIYLKSLFNGIYFPENENYEDIRTLYRVIERARVLVYKPISLYFYTQREGSIVHTQGVKDQTEYFIAILQLACFFKSNYPRLFNEECLYLIPAAYEYCLNYYDTKGSLYNRALSIIKENPIPKKATFFMKIKLIMIKTLPCSIGVFRLIKVMRNRRRIGQ